MKKTILLFCIVAALMGLTIAGTSKPSVGNINQLIKYDTLPTDTMNKMPNDTFGGINDSNLKVKKDSFK